MFRHITPAQVEAAQRMIARGESRGNVLAACGIGKSTYDNIKGGKPVGRTPKRRTAAGTSWQLETPQECPGCAARIIELPCRVCETRWWLAKLEQLKPLEGLTEKLCGLVHKAQGAASAGDWHGVLRHLEATRAAAYAVVDAAVTCSKR